MSLAAQYVDGVLQTQTTSSESLSSTKKNGSTVSSDTFLSLLVAEMQNQDPLQPTSNTEWVSQYATFTQVEQISEMANSLDVMRANSLVGKEVIMKVTNASTGEITYVRGPVDYIAMEEGKALLNINGSNYSMDDLDTVASPEYMEAYDLYNEFVNKVGALPSGIGNIDATYENVLREIYDMCKDMTEYQTNYLQTYAPTELEYYKECLTKLKEYGISFEEEEKKEITLEDILNAFNEKMEGRMTQVSEMSEKVANLESANKA